MESLDINRNRIITPKKEYNLNPDVFFGMSLCTSEDFNLINISEPDDKQLNRNIENALNHLKWKGRIVIEDIGNAWISIYKLRTENVDIKIKYEDGFIIENGNQELIDYKEINKQQFMELCQIK